MEEPRSSRKISKFSSNCKRRLSRESHKNYKNYVQNRKTHQIVLLCTDLTDKPKSKHVVDSAVALTNHGHKVTVITSAFLSTLYSEDLSKIGIIQAGRWIPKHLCGQMKNFFYFFRSLYTTLYMIYTCRQILPEACAVFCETSCFMIPILKLLTNYKIIYFQYEFGLSNLRMPAKDIKYKNWLLSKCLQGADQILVPNKVFYDIYERSFPGININPFVCQPYLNVRKLKKEKLTPLNQTFENINSDTLIFLVLGEYHPRSNLELALDAFHLLLHTTDHADHSRLRLVIGGHVDRDRASYIRHLGKRAKQLQLGSKIMFQPRPSRHQKKSLLGGCAAMVTCQEYGLWDRYVLEAMSLGRPIIAVNNGFTNEILENGVTGYVVPGTPHHFCAAMFEIISNVGKGEFIGKMAHCEFIKKYSLEAYGARLNKIIHNFFEKDHESENQNAVILDSYSDLLFG